MPSAVLVSSSNDAVTTQPSKSDVANLSHAQINEMSNQEMLRVIAVADLPCTQQTELSFQSTQMLRQLTHLASHSCRNLG